MLIMGFSVPKRVMYVYVHVLYINSEDIDMSDISRGGGFECTSDISSVSERGTDQARSNHVSKSTSSMESRRASPLQNTSSADLVGRVVRYTIDTWRYLAVAVNKAVVSGLSLSPLVPVIPFLLPSPFPFPFLFPFAFPSLSLPSLFHYPFYSPFPLPSLSLPLSLPIPSFPALKLAKHVSRLEYVGCNIHHRPGSHNRPSNAILPFRCGLFKWYLQLATLAGSLVRNLSQARVLRPVPDAKRRSSCLTESLHCMVMTSNQKSKNIHLTCDSGGPASNLGHQISC